MRRETRPRRSRSRSVCVSAFCVTPCTRRRSSLKRVVSSVSTPSTRTVHLFATLARISRAGQEAEKASKRFMVSFGNLGDFGYPTSQKIPTAISFAFRTTQPTDGERLDEALLRPGSLLPFPPHRAARERPGLRPREGRHQDAQVRRRRRLLRHQRQGLRPRARAGRRHAL